MLKLTILGTGSATPSLLRNPSAQIINDDHETYLIDCGEGTQIQILKYKIKVNKLKNIFISHLHGDHYFGLIGLLSSLNLAHRTEAVTIFGPKGLDKIINIQLKYANTTLHFPLIFIEVVATKSEILVDNEHITISTIPLKHRVPCLGFLFFQKPNKRGIIKEKLIPEITIEQIIKLKDGIDIIENNQIKFAFDEYTTPPNPGKKYAYCSDTAYSEKIITIIDGVDVLYHEATFRNDLESRAKSTFHSTAKQAALIAKKASVKKLILGHFSSRYNDLSENLQEAKEVFENTIIGEEGNTLII